jgi:hypothetical protein
MTPSQLVGACASARELDEILIYDTLEPALSRRDVIQIAADLLAKLHNVHCTNTIRPEDLYPELRPEDWQQRQRRRVQLEDQRLRAAAARQKNSNGEPGR